MIQKIACLILLFSSIAYTGYSSENNNPYHSSSKQADSISTSPLWKKSVLPVSTIALGFLISGSGFEKQLQQDIRSRTGDDFFTPVDDYIQYMPVALLYMANLAGVKGKNHWFDQTKYMLMSNITSAIITHSLKRIVQKPRPYGGTYAIPSGHTSLVFTNATVLFHEYKGIAPILPIAGYSLAGTTAALRVANNKHWISDVIAGAGVGILSAHLIYHFEPFKSFNPFIRTKSITLLPTLNPDELGLYFSLRF